MLQYLFLYRLQHSATTNFLLLWLPTVSSVCGVGYVFNILKDLFTIYTSLAWFPTTNFYTALSALSLHAHDTSFTWYMLSSSLICPKMLALWHSAQIPNPFPQNASPPNSHSTFLCFLFNMVLNMYVVSLIL